MVCIHEIEDNLTSKAESTNATSLGTSSPNDSMKIPPPNEMYLLNAHCEKSMAQEVQVYFKSYREFIKFFARMIAKGNHQCFKCHQCRSL